MTRYNSTHEQFSQAKALANQAYQAKMLPVIEELLSFGYGYHALTSALNTKGYLTPRGKPFSRESVRCLLRNLNLVTAGAEEDEPV